LHMNKIFLRPLAEIIETILCQTLTQKIIKW